MNTHKLRMLTGVVVAGLASSVAGCDNTDIVQPQNRFPAIQLDPGF